MTMKMFLIGLALLVGGADATTARERAIEPERPQDTLRLDPPIDTASMVVASIPYWREHATVGSCEQLFDFPFVWRESAWRPETVAAIRAAIDGRRAVWMPATGALYDVRLGVLLRRADGTADTLGIGGNLMQYRGQLFEVDPPLVAEIARLIPTDHRSVLIETLRAVYGIAIE